MRSISEDPHRQNLHTSAYLDLCWWLKIQIPVYYSIRDPWDIFNEAGDLQITRPQGSQCSLSWFDLMEQCWLNSAGHSKLWHPSNTTHRYLHEASNMTLHWLNSHAWSLGLPFMETTKTFIVFFSNENLSVVVHQSIPDPVPRSSRTKTQRHKSSLVVKESEGDQ